MIRNIPLRKNMMRQRGVALLLLVIFFMMSSLVVVLGIGRTAYYDTLRHRTLGVSKQSYYTTESGLSDVLYRLRKGKTTAATEILTLAGATATTTQSTIADTITIQTEGVKNTLSRNSRAVMHLGDGASFNFGLQSGEGGITLANSSSVIGNVYSNGSVTGAGNMVYGDVVSAASTGLISSIHATGSAYAHTIQSSTIDKDAYYQTKTGTTVLGTSFPGSVDQPTSTLPIDDPTIAQWESDAAAGGVISGASCPGGVYTINSSVSIGPKKIACDVTVDKSSTVVTLTGPLWITGSLTTKNGPTLQVDPLATSRSVAIIVASTTNLLTSSQMTLDQSTGFVGSGSNSYILLISMNNSAETGGAQAAIDAGNKTTTGQREVIYYASHGKLTASQSVKLRGATAYTIELSQSASVEYQTGMVSILFTGGSGGSYVLDSWSEVE